MVRKDGKVQKQLRTFGTTTRELLSLRHWLVSEGCTHVAMESTGVYWKPIYAVLEGGELKIVVVRELRDLTRYRRKLVEARSAERNRLLNLLESANIKLASAATDVFGVSGRRMMEALIEGTTSLPDMAQLAKGKLRNKIPQLEFALEGRLARISWQAQKQPHSQRERVLEDGPR